MCVDLTSHYRVVATYLCGGEHMPSLTTLDPARRRQARTA